MFFVNFLPQASGRIIHISLIRPKEDVREVIKQAFPYLHEQEKHKKGQDTVTYAPKSIITHNM